MEIATQSPMLALLLGVFLISPWEQIHHSLLCFQSLLFVISSGISAIYFVFL